MDSIKERYNATHQWLKVTEEKLETYLYNLRSWRDIVPVILKNLKGDQSRDQTGGNSGKLYVCYIFYDQFLKRINALLVDFHDGE